MMMVNLQYRKFPSNSDDFHCKISFKTWALQRIAQLDMTAGVHVNTKAAKQTCFPEETCSPPGKHSRKVECTSRKQNGTP